MQRLAVLALFQCATLLPLRAASPLLTLDNILIASPAGVGAFAPQFAADADGAISLSWIEPDHDNRPARRFSRFDSNTLDWTRPSSGGHVDPPKTEISHAASKSNAGRMAKASFFSDNNDPRVLVSISPNAGEQFLMPVRVDDSRPIGAPDLVLLSDGTVFVSWLEHYAQDEAALWLRRVSPGGERSVPVLLATLPNGRTQPRLALLADNTGGRIQLLLAYTLTNEGVSQVVTRRLSIAPPLASAATKGCASCPSSDEAARGYPLRAHVVMLQRKRSALTLRHPDIPGVLRAGTTEFKVAPELFNLVAAGADIFARVERRDSVWWLIDVRLIVRPKTATPPRS